MKAHYWHPLGLLASAIVIAVIVTAPLCVPLWGLWTAVLPYFWPTGPQGVVNPEFWKFFLVVLLFALLRKLFVGDAK